MAMKFRNLAFTLAVALWLLAFTERSAHAYIDPGAGSMFLQLLLAGVAGVWVLVRMYWRRLATKLWRRGDAEEHS